MEFETIEAHDAHEAQVLTSNILFRRYKDATKKFHEKKPDEFNTFLTGVGYTGISSSRY
jgi:hypothetical protein